MRGGACKTTRTILASFKKDPRSPTFFYKNRLTYFFGMV